MQCVKVYDQEQEKMRELADMKDFIGTDELGWVLHEDELAGAQGVVQTIKAGLMVDSSIEME